MSSSKCPYFLLLGLFESGNLTQMKFKGFEPISLNTILLYIAITNVSFSPQSKCEGKTTIQPELATVVNRACFKVFSEPVFALLLFG